MSKNNRKVMKNIKKQQAQNIDAKAKVMYKEMRNLIDADEYARAVELFAELVQLKQKKLSTAEDIEATYNCAYSYYMLGDYERAVKWVNNTLTMDRNHLKARLLLARICLFEDRTDDGLAIFDFVLSNYESVLSEDTKEELEEILEYYGETEETMISDRYPAIAKFLGMDQIIPDNKREVEGEMSAEASCEIDDNQCVDAETQSMIAEMKALLQKSTINSNAGVDVSGGTHTFEISENKAIIDVDAQPKAINDCQKNVEDVLENNISLVKKIKVLNAFAGAAFVNKDYESARIYLQNALSLDCGHDATIRNLAILEKCAGDGDKALEYVAMLEMTDFCLLSLLAD